MRTAFAAAGFVAFIATAFPAETRAETVKVEAFTFAVPEGWTSVTPSSPMRKAQLEIARGPQKAEVTFFHFGADQGGTAEDNVARWYAQFPGSEKNRITEHMQIGPTHAARADAHKHVVRPHLRHRPRVIEPEGCSRSIQNHGTHAAKIDRWPGCSNAYRYFRNSSA